MRDVAKGQFSIFNQRLREKSCQQYFAKRAHRPQEGLGLARGAVPHSSVSGKERRAAGSVHDVVGLEVLHDGGDEKGADPVGDVPIDGFKIDVEGVS